MNVSKFVPVASPFDAIHTLEIIPNLARGRARASLTFRYAGTPRAGSCAAGIDCNLFARCAVQIIEIATSAGPETPAALIGGGRRGERARGSPSR